MWSLAQLLVLRFRLALGILMGWRSRKEDCSCTVESKRGLDELELVWRRRSLTVWEPRIKLSSDGSFRSRGRRCC
jgi:hypothetical protein